ncbi:MULTISPECIES: hypothetical protein [unclassified Corynebacterium]|uniref:hypothetical protein n=1 Tax=unclassified Corynebacterium TaxID=2624378 RepID=UPI0029CA7ABF|nr:MULTISPECIES: hypothetical protein [unclassified Corynebacterium]WPF66711.1 hypothetical protein OLX12_02990 [Corynebacterium sp. 22KM0430]WPF69199.1 hypothetical protein OLW90_02985 [Corynebacterium sp. 21KM1197]
MVISVISATLAASPALAAEQRDEGGVVKQKQTKAKDSPADDVLYFIERLVPLTSRAVTFQ